MKAFIVDRYGSADRVRRFKAGDEVYARPDNNRIGTFAELIAVKEDDLAIKPEGLTMEEAASIPLVALTAWQALVEKTKLKKGQKVLMHAGSGGVGTFAIQLAKHVGATVATTTSAANVDLVKRLGADIVIDYKKDRFEEVLRDCDVVLCSKSGSEDKPNIIRSTIPSFHESERDHLRQIGSLIEAGAIRSVLDRVFPFESIKEAMAYVETGRAKGQAVVKVR